MKLVQDESGLATEMDIFNRNIHPNNLKVQNVAFGSFKMSWGLSWYESKAAVERSSYVVSLTSNDLSSKIVAKTNSIEIDNLEPGEYQGTFHFSWLKIEFLWLIMLYCNLLK